MSLVPSYDAVVGTISIAIADTVTIWTTNADYVVILLLMFLSNVVMCANVESSTKPSFSDRSVDAVQ
jgi:hypothetical protein